MSRQLDDLEPTLTRHGYRIKDLVEQFDSKPTEIKVLFSNALDPARTTSCATGCWRRGCRFEIVYFNSQPI
uniref:Type II secretory pathway, component ExeA (Predicted ATPase) n=1 Tax=Pseudomonas syringae TaxID=317 RepID=I3W0H3_PSESX|nr:Type II secretory pathway, component ExeA (predicted ATPase) [Pseudomonas syringae]